VATQGNDTLYVIAAAYDDVDAALADYEAVEELYREVESSHDFDAAVIAKNENRNVRSSRSTSSRPATARPSVSGWGLAVGVTSLLFPPAGIGLAAAGGAGAAIGGVAGHASGGCREAT
jgi:uncharacterized membrane protein